jgi:predicted transcriptional regulator of viral defense system
MITVQGAKEVFRQHNGVLRTSEALDADITPSTLYDMLDKGIITEVARGVYRLSEYPALSNPDFVTVALRYPRAVIALISALNYYELTTQFPHAVYIALPRGYKKPETDYPPLEVVWLSTPSYEAGIQMVRMDGKSVKIYDREKTICDAFKFRNKYGEDVAVEALKNYLQQPGSKRDFATLMQYARINRVQTVMRPYLQGLV